MGAVPQLLGTGKIEYVAPVSFDDFGKWLPGSGQRPTVILDPGRQPDGPEPAGLSITSTIDGSSRKVAIAGRKRCAARLMGGV